MDSSPISQQMSQDEIDGNCLALQAVDNRNDNLAIQVDDFEGLEEISTNSVMQIEGGKILGEDNIIGGMPRKGMQFPSADEAREFYNEYAKRMGFSIRMESAKRSTPDRPINRKYFVCYKAGKKRNYKPKKIRTCDRPDRVNCCARMSVLFKNGVWIISQFIDEHNHEMFTSPNKVKKLRSHNKEHLLPETIELMNQYKQAGCEPSKIARLLNVTGNSTSNITPQQCQQHLRKKRESNIGRECMIVMQQFLYMTASDENFYHTIEIDRDGVCRSLFWADGRAREMYQNFGDVVVFDVTYRTNTFLLPFAPFTGVNHHGQSTLFGCAFLSDEQEDTFVWLFERWLRCMGGKAPGAIITDQDPAITNAIKRVFPNTRHRFCSWHISLHEDEHLRALRSSYNPRFDEQYYKWVRKSKTIEEAESAWKELKEKYKQEFMEPLTDKQRNEKKSWKWLESMYGQRYSWIDVYLRDRFFAGMRSSQQSESINSFFDGYVNSMTPLSEFVGQYARALQCRHDEEVNEDMWTMRAKPNPCHLHKLEVQVGMVYTRKMFAKFQSEFKDSLYCVHDEVATSDGMTTYDVSYGFGGKADSHFVRCNPSKEEFACTCGKFETSGILCKHILHIMMQCYRMEDIPEQYILARWTLAYRHSSKQTQLISTSNDLVVSALDSWNLRKSLNEVHDQAVSHGKLYNATVSVVEDLKRQLYSMRKELEGLVTEQREQNVGAQAISEDVILSNINIRDPERVRTKGRAKELSRIPAGKQVSQNAAHVRRRTCSRCGIKGHDSRTCGKTKEKVENDGSTSQSPHAEE